MHGRAKQARWGDRRRVAPACRHRGLGRRATAPGAQGVGQGGGRTYKFEKFVAQLQPRQRGLDAQPLVRPELEDHARSARLPAGPRHPHGTALPAAFFG